MKYLNKLTSVSAILLAAFVFAFSTNSNAGEIDSTVSVKKEQMNPKTVEIVIDGERITDVTTLPVGSVERKKLSCRIYCFITAGTQFSAIATAHMLVGMIMEM